MRKFKSPDGKYKKAISSPLTYVFCFCCPPIYFLFKRNWMYATLFSVAYVVYFSVPIAGIFYVILIFTMLLLGCLETINSRQLIDKGYTEVRPENYKDVSKSFKLNDGSIITVDEFMSMTSAKQDEITDKMSKSDEKSLRKLCDPFNWSVGLITLGMVLVLYALFWFALT